MKNSTPTIVGAGLSGLIAAHLWPKAKVIESRPESNESHRAVLRFRTTAVQSVTGIDFRCVTVRKGIWYNGQFCHPDIRLANWYTAKVLNGALISDRSIWSLDPAQRYVAPSDFYTRLIETVGPRIQWNTQFDFHNTSDWLLDQPSSPVISTVPLPITANSVGIQLPFACRYAPIGVIRFLISDSDLYQTVYYPDPATPLYRVSITGNLMIVEFAANLDISSNLASTDNAAVMDRYHMRDDICDSFGLSQYQLEPHSDFNTPHRQAFGKIADVPAIARRQVLFQLTSKLGIYSLGRFATWRNILLDDIPNDCRIIRNLMNGDQYMGAIRTSGTPMPF